MILAWSALGGLLAPPARAGREPLTVPGFGTVVLAGNSQARPHPSHVAILLSGEKAWDGTMQRMAHSLTAGGALVVGVDTPAFLTRQGKRGECSYLAGSFENLAQMVEKRLAYPSYTPPVLVGYALGSVLAYAALAEAPPGTFLGAVSVGFRPEATLDRPFCAGRDLSWERGREANRYRFHPAPAVEQPWVLVRDGADPSFPAVEAAEFVRRVGHGQRLDSSPTGSHSPAAASWEPRLRKAFRAVTAAATAAGQEGEAGAQAAGLDDLPLFELPGQGKPAGALAVVVSGDGGWTGIDRKITRALAEQGVDVVGLNSRRYFWTARTPARAATDLERILRHYLAAWHCHQVLLIGYSLGADALAFMAGRLPPDLLARVGLIALLSPDTTARLEIGSDLEPARADAPELQILPAVLRLAGRPVLCVDGDQEHDSLCERLTPAQGRAVRLPGSHAFDGDASAVTATILAAAKIGAHAARGPAAARSGS